MVKLTEKIITLRQSKNGLVFYTSRGKYIENNFK